MATEVKPVYKSNDGEEHATPEAARRHNKVLSKVKAFEKAATEVAEALKERALTADGVPFVPQESSTFYWLFPAYFSGLPELRRICVYGYHATIDMDRNGALVVREYNYDRKEYQEYAIKDLYVDRKRAEAAHLDLCQERMAELEQRIGSLRKEYGH